MEHRLCVLCVQCLPEVSHPSEFYIDSNITFKAENALSSRKIILKCVADMSSIIWNSFLWDSKSLKHQGKKTSEVNTITETIIHPQPHKGSFRSESFFNHSAKAGVKFCSSGYHGFLERITRLGG